MGEYVGIQVSLPGRSIGTVFTGIGLFTRVSAYVCDEIPLLSGAEGTVLARERFLPSVCSHVVPQICGNISGVGTDGALVVLVAVCEASWQTRCGSSPTSCLTVTLQPHL